jgi:hypothetical protein
MATEKVPISTQVEGVEQTIKAFNRLDKDAKKDARQSVLKVSERLASKLRASAPAGIRYQNLAASIRTKADRAPKVDIGRLANPKVSGGGGPRELIIGMEFGADQSGPNAWRFPPRTPRQGRGNAGYWIYPTAKRNQSEIVKLWRDSLNASIQKWSS